MTDETDEDRDPPSRMARMSAELAALDERCRAGAGTARALGILALLQGKTAASLNLYRRSTQLDPTSLEAWRARGRILEIVEGHEAELDQVRARISMMEQGKPTAR